MNTLLLVVTLSIIGVVGDFFLKLASENTAPFASPMFYCGVLIYALLAVGWVFVFPHMKLGAVGAAYGVCTMFFLVIAGLFSGERLSVQEGVGIGLGALALILLKRF